MTRLTSLLALACVCSLGTAQAQVLEAKQPPGNESLFAINEGGELLHFRAGAPNKVLQRKKITGLNEDVRGMDFRVSHGTLFVLGASGRLYTLDTESAAAKPVGDAPLALPMSKPASISIPQWTACGLLWRMAATCGRIRSPGRRLIPTPRSTACSATVR